MNKLKNINSMRTINKFRMPINRQIQYGKKQEIEGSEVSDPKSFELKNKPSTLKSSDGHINNKNDEVKNED